MNEQTSNIKSEKDLDTEETVVQYLQGIGLHGELTTYNHRRVFLPEFNEAENMDTSNRKEKRF